MNSDVIPNDVQRFILVSVPSVPFLEAMLLTRNEAAEPWDGPRLGRRLYLPEKTATALLDELQGAGILMADPARPGSYRYGPASNELDAMIQKLGAVYAANLIEVTNLIHAKTAKKAFRFADAFKWKKES
jgi:hypothetical protein